MPLETNEQMASLYRKMEMHDIPEEIIERIAQKIHQEYYSEALKELEMQYMFRSVYNQPYPTEYYIDGWVDWTTVVVPLRNNAFVLYHEFFDAPFTEEVIAEGTYEGNVYTFHRFAYKQYTPNKKKITNLASYLETNDSLPLEYLTSVLSPSYETYTYNQNKQCKSFEDWDRITEWYKEFI